MIKLNLTATNLAQVQIKDYLENNVSETLADKINNDVQIVKDNKTLLNKKDLDGFWRFATEKARKNAEKGANGSYVDDETVFGWAIHYFEEDSIEGKLYNEDGTEYKTVIQKPTPKIETKPQPKKPDNKQATLFDLFDMSNKDTEKQEEKDAEKKETLSYKAQLAKISQPDPLEYSLQHLGDEGEIYESEEPIEDDDEWTEEEIDEALEEIDKEFVTMDNQFVNTTTGEVIRKDEQTSLDKETMNVLYNLLDGKMDIR